MSEAITIAVIITIPPTLVAIASLIVGILNSKKTSDVKHELNSRLTELVEAVKKVAHQEGVADERERAAGEEAAQVSRETRQ